MDHERLEDVLTESLAMLSQIVIAEEQHPEFSVISNFFVKSISNWMGSYTTL